ncbi:MAG: hypothetical protein N3D11_09920 [Candidatus Sumerlaeia bacterium]|nr:hypothetical protein [Candidatus Sumerlaeia bacterium]
MRARILLPKIPALFFAAVLLVACPPPWLAPEWVHISGDLPLPPPPPFMLPPAPVVVHSDAAGCDYVAGVDYDIFYVDGFFYTHHQGRWFCTPRPGAAWVIVEPAYVPPILVPGPPRPGWRGVTVGPGRKITQFRSDYPFPRPSTPPPAAGKLRSRSEEPGPVRAGTPSSPGSMDKRKTNTPPPPVVPRGGAEQPGLRRKTPSFSRQKEPQTTVPLPAAATLRPQKPVTEAPTTKPAVAKPTPTAKTLPPEPVSETKPRSGRASGRK